MRERKRVVERLRELAREVLALEEDRAARPARGRKERDDRVDLGRVLERVQRKLERLAAEQGDNLLCARVRQGALALAAKDERSIVSPAGYAFVTFRLGL